MIFLKKRIYIYNKYNYFLNVKYKQNANILIYKGFFGLLKYNFLVFSKFNYYVFLIKNNELFFNLNIGWVAVLFLNGLGFKSTRKRTRLNQRYWRLNIGHSHVFQYFTPLNVILKSKNRYICIFTFTKSQLFNITQTLKMFKKINIYKGTGIHYPDELKILKIGKLKQ